MPSRTKSESVNKTTDKTKSTPRNSTKDKVQATYNEKRGTSTVYIPKDAASVLKSMSKTTDSKRRKEKTSVTKSTEKVSLSKTSDKSLVSRSNEQKTASTTSQKTSRSKNSENPLPKKVPRERRRSRTLSPSEVKMLNSAKHESDIEYDYEDDFEVRQSRF